MDQNNFNSTQGHLENIKHEDTEAEAFLPPELPANVDLDQELFNLYDKARGNIGQLYEISKNLENPSLYYGPALILEAFSSSRIEGTRTTMERIFEKEIELEDKEIDAKNEELNDPEEEVKALEDGIEYALDRIKKEPLSQDLIKRIHGEVFSGHDITSGKYREKQVWIGPETAPITEAQYVPPPADKIKERMENLVEYLNGESSEELPLLIKIAIGHYQFEAIHPFEDGNGRIGRLIILINLCDENLGEKPLLTGPFINLSNYFLRNRSKYYDSLMRVSTEGDYTQWIKFFLKAVERQSSHAIDTLEEIERLRSQYKDMVTEKGVPGVSRKVIDQLFQNPIITIPKVEKEFGVSYQNAYDTVDKLQEKGILEPMEPNTRPKKFVCREILDIVYSDFEWSI